LPCATLDGGAVKTMAHDITTKWLAEGRDVIDVSSEGWWQADEIIRLSEEDQAAIQQFRSEILAAEEFEDKKRRDRARADANLRRAFNDLLLRLERGYGAHDTDRRALLAIACFLEQMGPAYLARFADQFARVAQTLQDRAEGRGVASRSDPTIVWLARTHVALAVETMCWVIDPMRGISHSRESAAKWAAKRHPELERLITERGHAPRRGKSLWKAIVSWCRELSGHKVKNDAVKKMYAEGLRVLEISASKCTPDQIEAEANKQLECAVRLAAQLRAD
jgi:hypothetical protein